MKDNTLHMKLDLIAQKLGAYVIEDVVTVMRRQVEQDGRTVDIIDYFPPWNAAGTYGRMKVAHEYMDDDWQVKRFEKYSGLTLAALPVYPGDTAMRRKSPKPTKWEVALPTPFRLMLIPRKDDEGNNEKTLIASFIPVQGGRRAQPTAVPEQPPAEPRPAKPRPAAPAGGGGNGNRRPTSRAGSRPATAQAMATSTATTTAQPPARPDKPRQATAADTVTAERMHWLEAEQASSESLFYAAARQAIPYFAEKEADVIARAGQSLCGPWQGERPLVMARLAVLNHYATRAEAMEAGLEPKNTAVLLEGARQMWAVEVNKFGALTARQ